MLGEFSTNIWWPTLTTEPQLGPTQDWLFHAAFVDNSQVHAQCAGHHRRTDGLELPYSQLLTETYAYATMMPCVRCCNAGSVCRNAAKEQVTTVSLEGIKGSYVRVSLRRWPWAGSYRMSRSSLVVRERHFYQSELYLETKESCDGSLHVEAWNSLEQMKCRAQASAHRWQGSGGTHGSWKALCEPQRVWTLLGRWLGTSKEV